MTTRYIVAPGRVLVLPVSEGAAPGGGNRALAAGEVLDVVPPLSRFVRRRIAAGDLIPAPASPPAARPKEG